MLLVAGDEGAQALRVGLVAGAAGCWGERIVEAVVEAAQVGAEGADVGVGAGDVRAAGPAVVDVGGDRVVGAFAQLAHGGGLVEHAVHGTAGKDLQRRVCDEVAGLAGGVHDAAGEAGVDLADAAAVLVGGGAADVPAVGEVLVGFGELFQA